MAPTEWWAGYAGDEAAFAELAAQLPDLKIRRQDGQVLLGGPPLGLTRQETLREDLSGIRGLPYLTGLMCMHEALHELST